MGVISTRVASACSISEDGRSPQARATAMAGSARHHRKVAGQLTWLPARQRSRSTTSTAAARASSSHSVVRSEEHTSELQSPCNLVCRLLLEKKKSQAQSSYIRPRTQYHHRICLLD